MPPRRVSEASPVQVYLGPEEQTRLTQLAERLKTTKSEVLRRGLLALEAETRELGEHPALQFIGMITSAKTDWSVDPAREHDRVLADGEEQSWARPPAAAPAKRGTAKVARRRRGG